jgi:hypothetical protein
MKDKKEKNRISIHDADIPMDKNDTLDLSEVPDDELFVRDEDIIGLSDDSPISVRHTDETLDDAEDDIISEEDYDVNAETIIAPSETEMSLTSEDSESDDHDSLNIGDVFDTDSQAIVAFEDSDETISGFEEELADFVEDESDMSERIIVSEPIAIEKAAPPDAQEPEEEILELGSDAIPIGTEAIVLPDEQEPEDEILELGTEAIVEPADQSEEEDETIELLVLAEELQDKDVQDIRDIDDILGLGAEILENTRELIVPVGFQPDADDAGVSDGREDILQNQSEAKLFDDEDNFMSEVRQILAAQEAAELKTDAAAENVREPFPMSDIPASDDVSQQLSEEKHDDVSEPDAEDIIAPMKDSSSTEEDEILDADSEPVIVSPNREVFSGEDKDSPKDENNLLNIDIDLELAEKVFEKAEEDEDISDLNAETIIAPPEHQAEISEPVREDKDENNLLNIDIDLELAEKVFEKAEEDEDISDLNAETIISPPEHPVESLRQNRDNSNLLDIDIDLDIAEEVSEKAEEDEDISDLNAETIISPPEHPAESLRQDKDNSNLLDIDIDSELAEEVSAKVEHDEDISDLNAETIISPPEHPAEPIHKNKDDDNLLDIDIDSDIVETAEKEVISELNTETIIALAEDIPSPHQPEKYLAELSEDDIFDLAPETIISSPHQDSTTDISSAYQDSTTDISPSQQKLAIEEMSEKDSFADREPETVILPKKPEIPDKIYDLDKDAVDEKDLTQEISEDIEIERLPVKKEIITESVPKVSEESPSELEILDGEELKDEEKDLLKFLEMDLVPLDIPPETEKKKEQEKNTDIEEDEYVPIEEIIKNPQEGEGTVIEDMFRPPDSYETKAESSVYISITPEQMEAALERVIQKVFSEKIEHIVTQVIEKTFTEELEKKLRIILMQDDERR